MIYRYAARHEIMLAATIYVDHLLRIAVEQRKPRALNLHHDTVPFEKRMGNARHRQTHLLDTAGLEWLALREAVAVAAADDVAANERLPAVWRAVDELDHEIGIGRRERGIEPDTRSSPSNAYSVSSEPLAA